MVLNIIYSVRSLLLGFIMSWQLLAGWLQYAKAFINRKTGNTEIAQGLVEYALILVLVAVVMVILLTILGTGINNIFSNILTWIEDAGNS